MNGNPAALTTCSRLWQEYQWDDCYLRPLQAARGAERHRKRASLDGGPIPGRWDWELDLEARVCLAVLSKQEKD